MSAHLIDILGGEAALRKLVEDFYDLIETLPEGESLRVLHLRGHGIAHTREEQFNFLCGFLGGRKYYMEKHGHMDLRQMHAHVAIAPRDAENWLFCMDLALEQNGFTGPQIDQLRDRFRKICMMLVNDLAEWGMPASPGKMLPSPDP